MKPNQPTHSPSPAEEYVSLRDHADQTDVLATFTPGPWRIGDGGYTVFGPPSEHPAPVTIAMLLPATSRVSQSERDANARLVASAPMLLQALQQVISIESDTWYCDHCDRHAPKNERGELTGQLLVHHESCAILAARAAIAKATRG